MPKPDEKALTLYRIEEDLAALLDTEALVPEEQLAEFQAELLAKTQQGIQKRGNCIRAIRHIENQIELARAEENRLAEWRRSLAGGLDRFREYVIKCIEVSGAKRVEADCGALSIQANPESIEVTDVDALPDKFKTVTLRMPADLYRQLIEEGLDGCDATFNPDKTAIKAALKAGRAVPGADIRYGKNRLVVR